MAHHLWYYEIVVPPPPFPFPLVRLRGFGSKITMNNERKPTEFPMKQSQLRWKQELDTRILSTNPGTLSVCFFNHFRTCKGRNITENIYHAHVGICECVCVHFYFILKKTPTTKKQHKKNPCFIKDSHILYFFFLFVSSELIPDRKFKELLFFEIFFVISSILEHFSKTKNHAS